MSDGAQSSADATGPFDAIDPRLNMFALANGMDLSKGEGYRRLVVEKAVEEVGSSA